MKYCTVCNTKFEDSISFCPTDGEVLEEDPTSLLGTVLDGQYQVEALLGKGGMGAVYRARHILLGDRVAIKLLPPEMRSNAEWLRRFQREGQAARRFRHPNAVTVYDLRTSGDGTIYLVMEYVEGHTLDAELRRHGRFSPAEAFTVLEPIMSVLNAAHAMGVVHRDLKPENIMIGKPGADGSSMVKLLDLGIAKMREVAGAEKSGNTALTIAGQMLGTPYYMSPEQWGELPRDGSSEIDGRADIYSLGVVFYELVAGKRPFTAVTLGEMRREHVSNKARPLNQFVPNVGPGFSRAVERAMAKDRADRQSTTGELANELRAALAEEGIGSGAFADGAGSLPANIVEMQSKLVTSVERGMPTVLTSGPLATSGIPGPSEAAPGSQSEAATMPTVISAPHDGEHSEPAAVAPETRQPIIAQPVSALASPALPVVAASRRSRLLFIGVAVVALLVLGVGGFAVMHFMKGKSDKGGNLTPTDSPDPRTDLSAVEHEIGHYWLQVRTTNKSEAIRAGDPISLKSYDQFQLHFSPSENGYIYVVGPGGKKNNPMIFLTAKPSAASGLSTNEAKSGLDFSFPTKTSRVWGITLNDTLGLEEYTVVFSPVPLASPAFLSGPSEHPLTPDERQQWDSFLAQHKENTIVGEVVNADSKPFVPIKIPQNAEGAPAVFQFRIDHK
jgi:serine/threonine-protein kinase